MPIGSYPGYVSKGHAAIGTYPGYTGNYSSITGTYNVTSTTSGSVFEYTLSGLEPSTTGGWHVHAGTDCTTHACVGGKYYTAGTADPWTAVTWTSDANGDASGTLDFSAFDLRVNKHSIVVHLSDGTRAGHGSISQPAPLISGKYKVTSGKGLLQFEYTLNGLEPSTTGGWHVHEGTDCTTHACIGGHWYDQRLRSLERREVDFRCER